MSDIEALVLDSLRGRTKENPLTRRELKEIVGTKDSRSRGVIQSLRAQGYRIVSFANAEGYWITHDEAEYKAFRKEYLKKANTIVHNVVRMDRYTEGQEKLEV